MTTVEPLELIFTAVAYTCFLLNLLILRQLWIDWRAYRNATAEYRASKDGRAAIITLKALGAREVLKSLFQFCCVLLGISALFTPPPDGPDTFSRELIRWLIVAFEIAFAAESAVVPWVRRKLRTIYEEEDV